MPRFIAAQKLLCEQHGKNYEYRHVRIAASVHSTSQGRPDAPHITAACYTSIQPEHNPLLNEPEKFRAHEATFHLYVEWVGPNGEKLKWYDAQKKRNEVYGKDRFPYASMRLSSRGFTHQRGRNSTTPYQQRQMDEDRASERTKAEGLDLNFSVNIAKTPTPFGLRIPKLPTIVFVHGLIGSAEIWKAVLDAGNFDHDGYLVFSLNDRAESLHAFFDRVGLTEASGVTLVAHSSACSAASTFARTAPKLVKRLCLVSPLPTPLSTSTIDLVKQRQATSVSGMAAVALDHATQTRRIDDLEAVESKRPVALRDVRVALLAMSNSTYASRCNTLIKAKVGFSLPKAPCQILIVAGGDDRFSTPVLCRGYINGVANAEVMELANVGHWALLEDPTGTVACLRHLLSK